MTFPTYTDQVVQHPGDNSVLYFNAKEDLTQGQAVKLDTDGSGRTVEPATTGDKAIGFVEYDVSSGDMASVAVAGAVVRAVSNTGSISSGDAVTVDSGTNEGELKSAASGDWIIGTALQDDTGSNTEGTILVLVSAPNPYGNP
jgi:hypothetical protein